MLLNMKMDNSSDFTKKSSFCVAPWLHYYRSPAGKPRLCCLSGELDSSVDNMCYDELKNSKTFKDIRKMMMNGELPKACELCKNPHTHQLYKDDLNTKFSHHFEEILQNTRSDGETLVEATFLDYRHNKCNLTCLTCSSKNSSAWSSLVKVEDEIVVTENYHALLKEKNWEMIHFAGGEPLLITNHLDHLRILSGKANAKKIALNYTTNLSVNRKFIDRWIPLLNQLGKVHLGVSVDSYGKFNDLIRQGSDFDLIDKNLKRIYQTKAQNISVVIDVTMTSILFFNLIEFSRWIIENQHQTHFKMMIGFGQAGIFLRVESLKLEFRKQKIQEWQQWCETLSPSELSLLKNLKEMLSTHCLAPEFSSAYKLVNDEHREKIQSYNFMEMEDFLSSEMKDASIF